MSHTSGEKLLAVSHKLFKLATALVKGVAAQDERTPSSALKGFLDELHKHFAAMSRSSSSGTTTRARRA